MVLNSKVQFFKTMPDIVFTKLGQNPLNTGVNRHVMVKNQPKITYLK